MSKYKYKLNNKGVKLMEGKQESKGLSIASMVLGIISLVLCCFIYISLPCAILAVIFGIVGMKKGGKGMGIAGLVLGIITLAILALGALGIFSIGSALV